MNLVVGASGFIGRRVGASLQRDGLDWRAAWLAGRRVDLADCAGLAEVCAGVTTVFHCAGHAHAFSARGAEEEALHWRVNCEGTRNLLRAAGEAGVRRFVFLSSVKAMAEPGDACIDEDFPGVPPTAYGQAKRAAEAEVLEAGRRYGMHVVNLRLAMVYGAGGRGNLERMARLVGKGWFPPLPETGNRRSLVHVDDVVAAIRQVAEMPAAHARTYIVAAPEAPSGRALFAALRAAHGLPRCNWALPAGLLKGAAYLASGAERVLGRRLPFDREVLERLLGSACYSAARLEREIGWRARVSLAEGLARMLGK